MPWQDRLLIGAVLLLVVLSVVFVIYLATGGLYSFARRPLERCFEGIRLHAMPEPGDVTFVYHTYRGLLLWFTQTEHRVVAPPEDAEKLLKRLLRFNLTWGLLSYGLIFIPFVSYGNYRAQLRSIRQQAEAQVAN
jgi:hypothetical protein